MESGCKYKQSEANNTLKGSHTVIKWDLSQGYKDFAISINQSVLYTTSTHLTVKAIWSSP